MKNIDIIRKHLAVTATDVNGSRGVKSSIEYDTQFTVRMTDLQDYGYTPSYTKVFEYLNLVEKLYKESHTVIDDDAFLLNSSVDKDVFSYMLDNIAFKDTIDWDKSYVISDPLVFNEILSKYGEYERRDTIKLQEFLGLMLSYNVSYFDAFYLGDMINLNIGKDILLNITLQEAMSKDFSKEIYETMFVFDVVEKNLQANAQDFVSFFDLLDISFVKITEVVDTLAVLDSVILSPSLYKSDNMSFSESGEFAIDIKRLVTYGFQDILGFLTNKVVSDVLTLIEDIAYGRDLTPIAVADNISLLEAIIQAYGKYITDNLNISEDISKASSKLLSDVFSLLDSCSKDSSKEINETYFFAENFIKDFSPLFKDTIGINEIIAKEPSVLFVDSFGFTHLYAKNFGKNPSESVSFNNETTIKDYSKNPAESLSTVDTGTAVLFNYVDGTYMATPVDYVYGSSQSF